MNRRAWIYTGLACLGTMTATGGLTVLLNERPGIQVSQVTVTVTTPAPAAPVAEYPAPVTPTTITVIQQPSGTAKPSTAPECDMWCRNREPGNRKPSSERPSGQPTTTTGSPAVSTPVSTQSSTPAG
ncbi:hypothetical protein D5S17_11050 [Pseudonocardiaceae bacterium YIM PH 21723]|nr:hypothetical protein D5S17_11050 [Pseudonocardiaceae bacterium YIM PH 21723]